MSTRRDFLRSGAFSAAFAAMAGACSRPDQTVGADLAAFDAVETAARIRSGSLSAEEAVDAAIARARRIEPHINAIVTKTYRRAREEAPEAQGPWAGVPTFIKDLDDVTGVRTAFGTRAFPGYRGGEQTPCSAWGSLASAKVRRLNSGSPPRRSLSAAAPRETLGIRIIP